MAITSQEIREKVFPLDKKGYNVPAVDNFLEEIETEIDALNAEIARLQALVSEGGAVAEEQKEAEPAMDLDAALAEPAAEADLAKESEKDARIAELEQLLADKRAEDNAIAEALVTAQRSAQEVTNAAEEKARKIQNDAQENADGILERANAEREQIEDKISGLEETHVGFCEDYASVLRNFIADANKRLEEVNAEINRAQGNHARARAAKPAPNPIIASNRQAALNAAAAPGRAASSTGLADFDVDDID